MIVVPMLRQSGSPTLRAVGALLLASAAPLTAAELVVRDLSLQIETLPTDFSYTLKDATGTRSGNDAFSSGYGVSLAGRYSLAGPGDKRGFVVGAELTTGQYAYLDGGGYTTYGVRATGGYGFALSDRWAITPLIDAGVGAGNLNIVGNSAFDNYAASGLYYSYAARLGATFAFTDSMLVGVEAAYRGAMSSLKAGSTTITLDGAGPSILLDLTYRFSNSPATLE
jgi:hypothetical protein